MKYLMYMLWIFLCLGAPLSAVLFVLQGGFAGGHFKYDRAIGLLGLPWNHIPLPEYILKHDWVYIIAIPWVINTIIVVLLTIIYRCTIKK
jgi:hypothetical protein